MMKDHYRSAMFLLNFKTYPKKSSKTFFHEKSCQVPDFLYFVWAVDGRKVEVEPCR